MRRLKVGDELYTKQFPKWGMPECRYSLYKIERLTKTRAITECNTVLINADFDPKSNEKQFFYGYGNGGLFFLTPEIRENHAIQEKRISAYNWFASNYRAFTIEDKMKIQNLLDPTNP
jgi:hypothetical protein